MSEKKTEAKEEFYKKLSKLGIDDLRSYEKAAVTTRRTVSVLAISNILIGMYFPLIPVILVCSFFVMLLASLHNGVADSIAEIRKNIAKFE